MSDLQSKNGGVHCVAFKTIDVEPFESAIGVGGGLGGAGGSGTGIPETCGL